MIIFHVLVHTQFLYGDRDIYSICIWNIAFAIAFSNYLHLLEIKP